MIKELQESKMIFLYDEKNFYHIEKSPHYKKIQEGVRTVEFWKRIENGDFLFIEAKTSSPKIPLEFYTLADFNIELESIINKKNGSSSKEKLIFTENILSKRTIIEQNVNYTKFVNEIKEKFVHSLLLFLRLKSISEKDLPIDWNKSKFSELKIKFILIIKDHKSDWLASLYTELNKEFKPIFKTANFCSLILLNEEMARERKLVK